MALYIQFVKKYVKIIKIKYVLGIMKIIVSLMILRNKFVNLILF